MESLMRIAYRNRDCALCVLTRRTYHIFHEKRPALSSAQKPLVEEASYHDDGTLSEDIDLVVDKPATDVVVKGTAYSAGGKPVRRLDVAVGVAGRYKRVRVFGDRVCSSREERLRISEPESFTSMPLVYSRAYGGADETARDGLDKYRLNDLQKYVQYDLKNENLCVYRRNYIGKGFAIGEGRNIDGLNLPNLEDPDDLLSTRRIPTVDANKWYYQPVPAGFDWYDHRWFPRSAFMFLTSELGPWDALPKPGEPDIREIKIGHLSWDDLKKKATLEESVSTRFLNGASPGMVFPYLEGNELIELQNMDPQYPIFRFNLPGEKPRLFIRPLGEEAQEIKPELYSVIIYKDENLVSLVWGGFVRADKPYGPEQLEKVPYRAVW